MPTTLNKLFLLRRGILWALAPLGAREREGGCRGSAPARRRRASWFFVGRGLCAGGADPPPTAGAARRLRLPASGRGVVGRGRYPSFACGATSPWRGGCLPPHPARRCRVALSRGGRGGQALALRLGFFPSPRSAGAESPSPASGRGDVSRGAR